MRGHTMFRMCVRLGKAYLSSKVFGVSSLAPILAGFVHLLTNVVEMVIIRKLIRVCAGQSVNINSCCSVLLLLVSPALHAAVLSRYSSRAPCCCTPGAFLARSHSLALLPRSPGALLCPGALGSPARCFRRSRCCTLPALLFPTHLPGTPPRCMLLHSPGAHVAARRILLPRSPGAPLLLYSRGTPRALLLHSRRSARAQGSRAPLLLHSLGTPGAHCFRVSVLLLPRSRYSHARAQGFRRFCVARSPARLHYRRTTSPLPCAFVARILSARCYTPPVLSRAGARLPALSALARSQVLHAAASRGTPRASLSALLFFARALSRCCKLPALPGALLLLLYSLCSIRVGAWCCKARAASGSPVLLFPAHFPGALLCPGAPVLLFPGTPRAQGSQLSRALLPVLLPARALIVPLSLGVLLSVLHAAALPRYSARCCCTPGAIPVLLFPARSMLLHFLRYSARARLPARCCSPLTSPALPAHSHSLALLPHSRRFLLPVLLWWGVRCCCVPALSLCCFRFSPVLRAQVFRRAFVALLLSLSRRVTVSRRSRSPPRFPLLCSACSRCSLCGVPPVRAWCFLRALLLFPARSMLLHPRYSARARLPALFCGGARSPILPAWCCKARAAPGALLSRYSRCCTLPALPVGRKTLRRATSVLSPRSRTLPPPGTATLSRRSRYSHARARLPPPVLLLCPGSPCGRSHYPALSVPGTLPRYFPGTRSPRGCKASALPAAPPILRARKVPRRTAPVLQGARCFRALPALPAATLSRRTLVLLFVLFMTPFRWITCT